MFSLPKFTFVLTILAFLFMTSTASPLAAGTNELGGPGSLLGRGYYTQQRAVDGTSNEAPLGVRGEHVARAPGAAAVVALAEDLEAFVPLKRSERFQRRVSARSRRALDVGFDTQN